jgi:hypothetical protein
VVTDAYSLCSGEGDASPWRAKDNADALPEGEICGLRRLVFISKYLGLIAIKVSGVERERSLTVSSLGSGVRSTALRSTLNCKET